jgi:hypothetical protein
MLPNLWRETVSVTLFVLLRVAQHLQDALGEMLIDISVSGNGLGNLCGGVVIPVVLPAVANKHAAARFELPDEVFPLHRSDNSASLRTPGISPLVRS